MANNTLKYLIELGLNDKATAAARRFDQQLLVVENHARQVNESLRDSTNGMESKFNMLGNSINQITRELPAFSVSANTGFLAISNNLPILADAIAAARKENGRLIASGLKATPVWKQVASSVFSLNTAITVGITLLTIYADDIADAIGSLLDFKKGADSASFAAEQLAEAERKGTEEAQKEIAQLNVLYRAATDDARSKEERLSAVKQLQSEYPSYFGNLSKEAILTGEASDAYKNISKRMIEAAQARAAMDRITQNSTRLLDLSDQKKNLEDQIKQAEEAWETLKNAQIATPYGTTRFSYDYFKIDYLKYRLKDTIDEIDRLNAANDKLASGVNVTALEGEKGSGKVNASLNTNLATLGGIQNRIAELKKEQQTASSEQAIALEREIRLLQQRKQEIENTIKIGVATSPNLDTLLPGTFDGMGTGTLSIPLQFDANALKRSWQQAKMQFNEMRRDVTITAKQMEGILNNSVASFADSLGQAVTSGNGLEALKTMLSAMMDMLSQFGQALIAAGTASIALKAVSWNGIGAIIAGGALVAATAAAKAALQNATAFADGAIVSGPTYALVGEYAGARSNPEVIAPLDKLRSLITPAYMDPGSFRLETKVRGRDLYVMLQGIEREKNRVR